MHLTKIGLTILMLVASCSFAAPDISAAGVTSDKVHVNQASEQQLASLKGVGQKRAAAIVAYRQAHGKFQALDEVAAVPGISKKTLDKITQQNQQRFAL